MWVLSVARDRLFWPHMKQDIEHFVQKACSCLKQRKPAHHTRAPLMNLTSTMPFDVVSIDYVHLEKSKVDAEYLLVIVDHFTWFAQAFSTKNKGGREQPLKRSSIIMFFAMDFLAGCPMTKGKNSNVT